MIDRSSLLKKKKSKYIFGRPTAEVDLVPSVRLLNRDAGREDRRILRSQTTALSGPR